MMTRSFLLAAVAAGALAVPHAAAQTTDHGQHGGMAMPPTPPPPDPGSTAPSRRQADGTPVERSAPPQVMDHAAMGHAGHDMADPAMMQHGAMPTMGSGTAVLPTAQPMRMVHAQAGDWRLMAHGYLWGAYTDQSGPRGDAMAFVQSMAMLTADRDIGGGATLQVRSMVSLEPLMGRRGYPNLLATGETAFGQPLVDRQHPHDLFMELAARIDVPVGGGHAFLYGGPVGEPALGPPAFMHRPSARYLPLAPITHHWFDSTHITYGVATAGYRSALYQLEGSIFTGREPDERRWNIERPRFDSWSARVTLTPSPAWALQVSHGRLEQPEAQHPGEDERRTTASVQYGAGPLSATLAGSAKNRLPGPMLTAWLGEVTWAPGNHHTLFARVENVANDELFPDDADPRHDRRYRVTRGEAGYAYRLPLAGPVELALGASALAIAVPRAIDAAYRDGTGYTLFARLALGR